MMKRSVDESDTFTKRMGLSESTEIDETMISSNSSSQIVHEFYRRTCQSPLLITLDSESDDERGVQTVDEEVIDLTEEESVSSLSSQSSIDTQECPICLETLSDLQDSGVHLLIAECRHIMCVLCTRRLLAIAHQCPLCRTDVSWTNLTPYCILT